MKAKIAGTIKITPRMQLPPVAEKPARTKPADKTPAFSLTAGKAGKHDGATRQRLEGPVKAKNAEGLLVVQSGELCRVKRVEALKGEFKGRYLIEFDQHPTRQAFTTVMLATDVLYQKIIDSYTE